MDSFDVLGLTPTFELDRETVEASYLARVRHLHPDVAAGDPAATRLAATLNDARAELLDPEKRAQVILARLGVAGDQSLPDGFLIEVMELREALDDARSTSDDAAVRAIGADARERRASRIERVSIMLKSAGVATSSEAGREIRREMNAWRYLQRLCDEAERTRGS